MDLYYIRKEYYEIMSKYFKIATIYQETYYKIKNVYELNIKKNNLWLKLFITDMIVFVAVMLALILFDAAKAFEGLQNNIVDPGKLVVLFAGSSLIAFLIILNRINSKKLFKQIKDERENNKTRYLAMERLIGQGYKLAISLIKDMLNLADEQVVMLLEDRYPDGYSQRDVCDLYEEIKARENGEYHDPVSSRERSKINDEKSKLYQEKRVV